MANNKNSYVRFSNSFSTEEALSSYLPGYIYFTTDNHDILMNGEIYGASSSYFSYEITEIKKEISYIREDISYDFAYLNDRIDFTAYEIKEIIEEDELVTAYALNDLNDRTCWEGEEYNEW